MTKGHDPRSFWNERFRKHGHTGDVDSLLYAYDQPQRLRAVDKVLLRAKIPVNSNTKILDVGCGTGDLIWSFMKHGEPDVTGIDISDAIISFARKRFACNGKLKLFTMAAEDMTFSSSSFDLVVGINVLQHIIDERAFSKAIQNMAKVSRTGGHILTMDFSPFEVKNRAPAPYFVVRSRNLYVRAFRNNGCRLVCEYGLPRIGVRLYRATHKIVAWLVKQTPNPQKKSVVENPPDSERHSRKARSQFFHLVRIMLLKLTKHFDDFMAPFPGRLTDMRILVFEKVP